MGVDLFGQGDVSFNSTAWRKLLEIATAFGWEPEGTEPPAEFTGEWDGSYSVNDSQEVNVTDARELGQALLRASAALKSGEKLPEELTEVLDGVDVRLIDELAAYALKGNFFIG